MLEKNKLGGGGTGLSRIFLSASAWTVASSVASQGIRFFANLILSRLLFPEAFGMMALVSAVMSGLEMFSDLGIGPSVIRNPAPARRFLDTVWTLQVVRGWGLWVIAVMMAYPMAQWYAEPKLMYLIPAIGLTSVIRAYAHTSQFTLNRELRLRELFRLEVGSQIVTVTTSVTAAIALRSVWALAIGGVVGALAWTFLTYRITKESRPHWCWDRDVLKSIRHFSYWVLSSTALTYLTNQGTSLIIGSLASMAELGLYSIANSIAGVAFQFINVLGSRVLFPLYVQIGGETTPLLKRRVAKVRIGLMSTVLPPLWILTCFGDLFVRLLWDPRYAGAGPMLQILSAGSLFWALEAGPIYLARGEAWIGFIVGAARAAVLLPAIAVGGYYFGMIGLVWGVAISQVPYYPLEVWMQRRYGVWTPWVDMLAFGTSMLFIGLGFLLRAHLNI